MPWKEEHLHVHVHCDNSEIINLLKEIRNILLAAGGNNDEQLRQEIYDKLNHAIEDIKSTIP